MNKAKRAEIFERFKAQNPNPRTELIYSSPFELMIAVILSAQATDKSVNKATQKLFAVANTPEAIIALGYDNLKKYIQSIGLFNTKAKNIIKTCQLLSTEYNSQIPENRVALERFPGVGRKTANVILNTIFKQPTIAVDTHIFRVANRIGIATGKDVRHVEEKLTRLIAPEYKQNSHHWLILHGRYTCVARKPKCSSCVIYDLCEFSEKSGRN
ncbi:Endonuclease III [uncultured Candidatus Thioglobus sp.]|nr:Endonuclease III [uncultured Candidatus Thioglobus sp.]